MAPQRSSAKRSSANPTEPASVPVPTPAGAEPAAEPLDKLLRRIRPRIERVLRSYDIPAQDAEDLLQEAVLEALRKWDSIQHLDAWLVGTLGFKCSHYWKKKRGDRVQGVDTPILEQLSEPQPPAQDRQAELLDLRSLMGGLGRRQREALWLRFGLGLSSEEVAERLGYCASSVLKLTNRSMARLRRWADAASNLD